MSQDVPSKFHSYAAMDKEAGKRFDVKDYEFSPPGWREDCVDIKISCCGVCGSCIHTVTGGWPGIKYPCTVGHEIIGTVVRAGKDSGHKVGARVGVGAQGGSCGECASCKADNQNNCLNGQVGTYQGKWPVDGSITQGGYADYHRTFGRFAIPIPDELTDEIAAPMMCGGVTTYTPLVENGAGPGKTVGIVGVGGLGHFGLMWSVALGADTWAISHSHSKEEDVYKMGVPKGNFIATSDIKAAAKANANKFDILVVTSNHNEQPLTELYFPLLKPHGKLVFVAAPEKPLPAISTFALIPKALSISGSAIGSPQQIKDMLALAVKHNVKSWIEVRPMSETGKTLQDLEDGKARYRYVLTNSKL